jgi:hypothetical protein
VGKFPEFSITSKLGRQASINSFIFDARMKKKTVEGSDGDNNIE